MKRWVPPKRNFKGIQFENLRRRVDPKFNEVHDVLSKAYYENKPFVWKGKNWGILDKETFDKLHGLIFQLRMLRFDAENKKQSEKDRIPEREYNEKYDEKGKIISKETDKARRQINKLKEEGIELEV